jgi:hypothetical protein
VDPAFARAPQRRPRARSERRDFVRLISPMRRNQRLECLACRLAGTKTLRRVEPGPRRQERQRDEVLKVGHGRVTSRAASTENEERSQPVRSNAQGPTSRPLL